MCKRPGTHYYGKGNDTDLNQVGLHKTSERLACNVQHEKPWEPLLRNAAMARRLQLHKPLRNFPSALPFSDVIFVCPQNTLWHISHVCIMLKKATHLSHLACVHTVPHHYGGFHAPTLSSTGIAGTQATLSPYFSFILHHQFNYSNLQMPDHRSLVSLSGTQGSFVAFGNNTFLSNLSVMP